ncbi:hypothetical protein C8J56DRAFT_897352 [Mycena floridula]|nr:hypothetical protein C8J56DRAFT_897352 [Mycena floridula]
MIGPSVKQRRLKTARLRLFLALPKPAAHTSATDPEARQIAQASPSCIESAAPIKAECVDHDPLPRIKSEFMSTQLPSNYTVKTHVLGDGVIGVLDPEDGSVANLNRDMSTFTDKLTEVKRCELDLTTIRRLINVFHKPLRKSHKMKEACTAIDQLSNRCTRKPIPKSKARPSHKYNHFMACNGWSRNFKDGHQTHSIPDNVSESILSNIVAGSLLVSLRVRSVRLNHNRYPFALVLHTGKGHNDPIPRTLKTSLGTKDKYCTCITADGVTGSTVWKVDTIAATGNLRGGVMTEI